MSLLDGANHDFRPLKGSEDIISNFRFVHSVGGVVDFDDLTDSEAGDVGAGDEGWEVGFGARDPDSQHGIDCDVADPECNHFVLDVLGVVYSICGLKAWEILGEVLVREVFEDEFFVVDGFLSVDGSHVLKPARLANVELRV